MQFKSIKAVKYSLSVLEYKLRQYNILKDAADNYRILNKKYVLKKLENVSLPNIDFDEMQHKAVPSGFLMICNYRKYLIR